MLITMYNSFIMPAVGFCWASDSGDCREIGCQMIMTCILLPYEMLAMWVREMAVIRLEVKVVLTRSGYI